MRQFPYAPFSYPPLARAKETGQTLIMLIYNLNDTIGLITEYSFYRGQYLFPVLNVRGTIDKFYFAAGKKREIPEEEEDGWW